MRSPPGTCFICKKSLALHEAHKGNLCSDPQCRWDYARIPSHQVCKTCGRPLLPSEFAAQTCENARCRRVNFAQTLEREREERTLLLEQARLLHAELEAQARVLRDQQAEAAGVAEPHRYELVVIPAFTAPITTVPARRRRRLRNHLARLIRQAARNRVARPIPPPPTPSPAPVQAVIGRACAQCQGHCCRNGGDEAYLISSIIQHYMDTHPEMRPHDVLAEYMRRVSNQSYQNSCIYHGTNGCGLTAEMRSDTCNLFFCEGLYGFQLSHDDGTDPVRVFLASERDGAFHATAFVDTSDGESVDSVNGSST